MSGLLRQIVAVLIAALFVVSGAAMQSCMALHHGGVSKAAASVVHGVAAAPSLAADHHQHHHAGGEPAADHSMPQPDGDQDCMKGCNLCTMTVAWAPDVRDGALLNTSSVVFAVIAKHLTGRTALVDPGIPKPAV